VARIPPPVADTRLAVRRSLAGLPPGSVVLVACSGGADSLALAAATAFVAPRLGLSAGLVTVDHGLQAGSADRAASVSAWAAALGFAPVLTRLVAVAGLPGGPEAAARTARYAALSSAAAESSAATVLLGHTRDDQAEQVLLGLARGSGARSLSGMPRRRDPFARPLLDLPRTTTEAACRAAGLDPWQDPHNDDPAYRRVRARRLLVALERDLGPGVVPALARSADLLRTDADLLDRLAGDAREALGEGPLDAVALAALPDAVRARVWRLVALEAGVPAGALFAVHVDALDALVGPRWRGQGPVDLPGGLQARRAGGQVLIGTTRPVQ
jgi:tRNA(Ile)-lysidine synthase